MSALGTPCNPCNPCDVDVNCVRCEPGVSDPNCVRYKLDQFPWERRQEMICGHGRDYSFAISPMGRDFLVTPKLDENTILKVVWDGYLYSFTDAEEVPFPAESAEAVAAYVMWKIARTVDKNIALSKEFEQDYLKLRLALFRDFNEGQFPDGRDEEFNGMNLPPGSNNGVINASISTWAQLMAVVTNYIATGASIPWVDSEAGGVFRVTQLRAGTDATDTAAGIARPDDYSATNQRVWYQTN